MGWARCTLPLQNERLFGIGGLADRPYTDPMKPAPLVVVLLPLLFGGCGKKESVAEGHSERTLARAKELLSAVEEKQQEVKPTEEAPVKPNLKYEIKGDAVTITGCDKKASGSLTIPATIEGKAVTSIGEKAFTGCASLTSITIPDSVNSIGNAVFAGCSSLRSITIGDGVTGIGDSAFYACTSLTSITIPDSVTSIGDSAFHACTSLTSITIPEGVTYIARGAFFQCTSLTSIMIGNGITSISNYAFVSCTSLTAVTFLGDAPKAGEEVFEKSSPTIYRKPEAKGWGDTFGGRPVKLISEKP